MQIPLLTLNLNISCTSPSYSYSPIPDTTALPQTVLSAIGLVNLGQEHNTDTRRGVEFPNHPFSQLGLGCCQLSLQLHDLRHH
mmetsp:Transcript_37123/g.66197  ORF Transcript_37123/g.66197 Transcript_37123/m.66197 type:complete len:83 (-) Transcript_37123:447-695(-)